MSKNTNKNDGIFLPTIPTAWGNMSRANIRVGVFALVSLLAVMLIALATVHGSMVPATTALAVWFVGNMALMGWVGVRETAAVRRAGW